jgi:hypothetical protein
MHSCFALHELGQWKPLGVVVEGKYGKLPVEELCEIAPLAEIETGTADVVLGQMEMKMFRSFQCRFVHSSKSSLDFGWTLMFGGVKVD